MKFLLIAILVFLYLVAWRVAYRACREAEHETASDPMSDDAIACISFFWPALLVLVAFAIPLMVGDRIFESIGGKRDNEDGKHSKGVYR